MKSLLLLAVSALLTIQALAEWKLETDTDPITDKISYTLHRPGENVSDPSFNLSYSPHLCVRVSALPTDTDLLHSLEIYFTIETEGLRRGRSSVIVRIDKSKAEDIAITSSTDRRAGFFTDPISLLDRMFDSSTLIIRYTTTLGHIRTTTFKLDDLKRELATVIKRHTDKIKKKEGEAKSHAADLPAGWNPTPPTTTNAPAAQKPTPPPKPRDRPCPKCRGAGSFYQWKPCPSCNGSTRGCDSCRNSGWIGRTKSMQECPRCKGFGTIKATSPSP